MILDDFGVDFDFLLPHGLFLGSGYGSKTVLESPHIDEQLLFSKYCPISALSCSFTFFYGRTDGGRDGPTRVLIEAPPPGA